MSTFHHPTTGVELNEITVRRPHLTEDEIETARLLRASGEAQQIIAAMLGTNQGRVAEALGEKNTDDRQPGFL